MSAGSTSPGEHDGLVSTVADSSAPAGLRLYVTDGRTCTSHALPASGALTLGRGGDCDIAIDDSSVSRLHAVLHIGAVLEIEDRGSHNGTRIGERRVASGQRRAVMAGEVIEAGCTFTGSDIKGEPGSPHPLACPAGCNKEVNVFGTDVYTSDTPVCAAAMHAGVMSPRGGEVTVVLEPGRPAYRGSKRNGITSRDWGTYRASFRFEGPRVVQAAPEVRAPVVVDAGCTFEGNQIHGEPGSVHRVSCPPGCKENSWAAGTDTYSGNSRVCLAAIHAGLSSEDGGGEFTLILGDKRPAFRGSKRNGVESHDWGSHDVSFRLQR